MVGRGCRSRGSGGGFNGGFPWWVLGGFHGGTWFRSKGTTFPPIGTTFPPTGTTFPLIYVPPNRNYVPFWQRIQVQTEDAERPTFDILARSRCHPSRLQLDECQPSTADRHPRTPSHQRHGRPAGASVIREGPQRESDSELSTLERRVHQAAGGVLLHASTRRRHRTRKQGRPDWGEPVSSGDPQVDHQYQPARSPAGAPRASSTATIA